jgi:hypothetical protein
MKQQRCDASNIVIMSMTVMGWQLWLASSTEDANNANFSACNTQGSGFFELDFSSVVGRALLMRGINQARMRRCHSC